MATATTSPHTLSIDGMSGDECVKKVTGALKSVNGVTTQSVEVGSATIESDDAGCRAACSAIGKSGYKAREDDASGETDADVELAPEVTSAEHKGRNQSGTPIMGASDAKHDKNAGADKAPGQQFGRST